MNSVKVKLIEALTYNGGHLQPGDEVELPEKSAVAAIAEGKAKRAETEDDQQPPADDKQDPGQQEALADDEIEKMKKALETKYTVPQLSEAAKAVGVEFAFDAKKADIVEAVILAGKGAALLK